MSDGSFNHKPVLRNFVVRSRCRHEYTQRTRESKAEWIPAVEYVEVEQKAQAPSLEAMLPLAAMMADRFVAGQESVTRGDFPDWLQGRYDFWILLNVEIWEHDSLLAKWSDEFVIAARVEASHVHG
jgi:hypothetical protein